MKTTDVFHFPFQAKYNTRGYKMSFTQLQSWAEGGAGVDELPESQYFWIEHFQGFLENRGGHAAPPRQPDGPVGPEKQAAVWRSFPSFLCPPHIYSKLQCIFHRVHMILWVSLVFIVSKLKVVIIMIKHISKNLVILLESLLFKKHVLWLGRRVKPNLKTIKKRNKVGYPSVDQG